MLACFVQYVKRGSTHVEMSSLKYIKKRINSACFEVRFARTCVKHNNENIQDNLQQIELTVETQVALEESQEFKGGEPKKNLIEIQCGATVCNLHTTCMRCMHVCLDL